MQVIRYDVASAIITSMFARKQTHLLNFAFSSFDVIVPFLQKSAIKGF